MTNMTNHYFELQDSLGSVLRGGEIGKCERTAVEHLSSLPHSPFHIVSELEITNRSTEVAKYFDVFFQREAERFKIKAAYAEMNGFDINPGHWFCDVFAFNQYGGHDDYDWLADWQSEDYEPLTISGLEPLQRVYASAAFQDRQFSDALAVTSLLVVLKFQDLIQKAAPHMHELRFPLQVTAHDYDFIFEVNPPGKVDPIL